MQGPCNWPVSYAACVLPEGETHPQPLASMAPSGIAQMESMATTYLWRWTNQMLGTCEITVRPCRDDCSEGLSTFNGSGPGVSGTPWSPVIIDGLWYNLGCGRCGDRCSCAYVPSLALPGPVASITEVIIDGVVLDATAYRVDNRRLLVRQDGGEWPRCNDLSLPAGEPGTWSVTYERGVEVPDGGQVAAGVLATELAKAACGDKECALPRRVQTVTRQGVTIAMLDAFDDVEKGHTGIWIIDSWLASMTQVPQRARVYSPDLPRPSRRTTWSSP